MESKVTMKQLLDDPANFEKHFQRFAGSVAVSVTYGRRIKTHDDWIVKEQLSAVDCKSLSEFLATQPLKETWLLADLVRYVVMLRTCQNATQMRPQISQRQVRIGWFLPIIV